jgi:HAD superfamily hydrolase (TIGR01509 family)
MIKLIIFDLDGVLVDAKNIHFETLNKALGNYQINWEEHLSIFDGLKTNQKLDILHKTKGLPVENFQQIWNDKQKYTIEALNHLSKNQILHDLINELSIQGYKLAVCSNSIKNTVVTVLQKLEILSYFDLILSNEDVKNSKPHPEIFWKAISEIGCLPEETLIVEDSPYGLLAASRSKSHVLRVRNNNDLNYTKIKNKLNQINNNQQNIIPAWKDETLNILIPMAGAGSRFEQAGYTFPKPLIEVRNKPMIQVVVENLNINANYIYIVQSKHRKSYNLDTLLNLITPDCKIVEVDHLTEGAACTALLAKEYINNDAPLFFANSDQFVEWDSNEFMYKMNETKVDGGIVTFEATHPKWSFAKLNEHGLVTEVAEKNPISNVATVGFYYWKHGSDFVKYAEQMIAKNIRVNNEFYVCPVFNEAIQDQKQIRNFKVERMWGLGTPEDLKFFIEQYK